MKKNKKIYIIILILLILIFASVLNITNNNKINKNKTNKKNIIDEKTQNILNMIKNNQEIMIYITQDKDKCLTCEFGDINIKYYNNLYNLNIPIYNIDKEENINYILKELNYSKKNIYTPALIHYKSGIITSYNEIAHNEDDIKNVLLETEYVKEENKKNNEKIIDEKEFIKLSTEQKNNIFLLLPINNNSYELRIILNNLSNKYNFNYYIIDYSKSSIFPILDQLEKINNNSIPKDIFITNNNKIIDSTNTKDTNKIESFFKKNQIIID